MQSQCSYRLFRHATFYHSDKLTLLITFGVAVTYVYTLVVCIS